MGDADAGVKAMIACEAFVQQVPETPIVQSSMIAINFLKSRFTPGTVHSMPAHLFDLAKQDGFNPAHLLPHEMMQCMVVAADHPDRFTKLVLFLGCFHGSLGCQVYSFAPLPLGGQAREARWLWAKPLEATRPGARNYVWRILRLVSKFQRFKDFKDFEISEINSLIINY